MSDFSGLGIVLEEESTSPSRPTSLAPVAEEVEIAEVPQSPKDVSKDEILLPPLPDENTSSLKGSITDMRSLDVLPNDLVAPRPVKNEGLTIDFFQNQLYSSYQLDSPTLKWDTSNLLSFPTSTDTLASSATSLTATTSAPSATNTSPLKSLKNFKNGIRKLSLSKHSIPTRPMLDPLQTQDHHVKSDSNSSASTIDSMKSSSPTATTNLMSYTRSSRSRTCSNSTISTPPLASPVITLSENLSRSKQNLSQMEQTFFENLATKNDNSSSSENDSITSYTKERVESISDVTCAEDLIDYSNYLTEQKKATIDAFEATRSRLVKSGWCSDHDLNNLQLQQDTSICELDSKLVHIEETLNTSFNLSLTNGVVTRKRSTGSVSYPVSRILSSSALHGSMSPSLKMLESRCVSLTEF